MNSPRAFQKEKLIPSIEPNVGPSRQSWPRSRGNHFLWKRSDIVLNSILSEVWGLIGVFQARPATLANYLLCLVSRTKVFKG